MAGCWLPCDEVCSETLTLWRCLQSHDWEPTIRNPFRGTVVWTTSERLEFVSTLFKDSRADEFEDKEWQFILEEVSLASSPWNESPVVLVLIKFRKILDF